MKINHILNSLILCAITFNCISNPIKSNSLLKKIGKKHPKDIQAVFVLGLGDCWKASSATKDIFQILNKHQVKNRTIVVQAFDKKSANKLLKKKLKLNDELLEGVKIINSLSKFKDLTDGSNSHFYLIKNKQILYNEKLVFAPSEIEKVLKNHSSSLSFSLKKIETKKIQDLDQILELAGYKIRKVNDSLIFAINVIFDGCYFFKKNSENWVVNEFLLSNKYYHSYLQNKQNENIVINDSLIKSIGYIPVHFENIYSKNNNIYLTAYLNYLYKNENDSLDLKLDRVLVELNNQLKAISVMEVLEPVKAYANFDASINGLENFYIDKNRNYFFKLFIGSQKSNEILSVDSGAILHFSASYEQKVNSLHCKILLNHSLPDFFVKNKWFYIKNYIHYFEYKDSLFYYFQFFPKFYHYHSNYTFSINELKKFANDTSTTERGYNFDYGISNSSIYKDKYLIMVLNKDFKRKIVVYNIPERKIAFEKKIPIKTNASFAIHENKLDVLVTPFFRKAKIITYKFAD